MGEVVIDLGEVAQQGREQPPSGWHPRASRAPMAALAVLLTVVLAGGAPVLTPVQPLTIPAALGDMVFPDSDRYFIVGRGNGGGPGRVAERVISMYRLPAAELVSQTTVTVVGTVTRLRAVDDVLMLSYQLDTVGDEATVAVAVDSGRVLWRQSAALSGLSRSGRVVLLLDEPGGGQPRHWYGVHPANGAVLWSHVAPIGASSDVALTDDGSPVQLVTATIAGRVEVRDPETGRVTAAADLPPPRDWRRRGIYIWTAGDLLLLGGAAGIDAYGLTDLSLRWRNTVDLTQVFILPQCGEALCLFGRFGGVHIIDPATGRQRWGSPRWALARRVGRYLLATSATGPVRERPLFVLDPVDGTERGTFGSWQIAGEPLPDGRFIGLRTLLSDNRVWYAVLDPADLSVRVLGAAERVTGECEVTVAVLACRRIDATVGVWPLTTR